MRAIRATKITIPLVSTCLWGTSRPFAHYYLLLWSSSPCTLLHFLFQAAALWWRCSYQHHLPAGRETPFQAALQTSLLCQPWATDSISSSALHKSPTPTPALTIPYRGGEGNKPQALHGICHGRECAPHVLWTRNSRLNSVLVPRAQPAKPSCVSDKQAAVQCEDKPQVLWAAFSLLLFTQHNHHGKGCASQEACWQSLSFVTMFYPNI